MNIMNSRNTLNTTNAPNTAKKANNKQGFTIVELVIVIAVIAILASVLIPTFSNIVDKANQSAAMQTARSTLTNALTMSSTAKLPGQDTNGNYQTVILVDGYAFGYTGNQLESIDYPGAENSTINALTYGTNFNTILLASANIDGDTLKNVAEVVTATTDFDGELKVVKLDGDYYVTDGSLVCELFLNSDFSNKVVMLTTFAGTISNELKQQVIEESGLNGYSVKESGKGSNVNFGDLQ